MAYSTIELQSDGKVAVITLNDPATLNAVTLKTIEEIDDALDDVCTFARAIVLTGAGRAFCSGANLSGGMGAAQTEGPPDAGASLETHINPLMMRLRDLPIPLVSAVKGSAAGVGSSPALAADMVVAGDSAFFLQAFARIGLVPDGGSSWLLAKTVGRRRAMEMMLLGERITAQKVLECGIVGCGQFAYATIGYYLRREFGRCVRSCYDVDAAAQASLARALSVPGRPASFEQQLDDAGLKTLYIASNHASHADYASLALQRGIDVYVEKPIAVRHDQLVRCCGPRAVVVRECGRATTARLPVQSSPCGAKCRSIRRADSRSSAS